ncbi:MAG TPA: glutamine-hydrolyzing GMP synthase [Candidatus Methylacidiphilales bacterium]|nr:glutamine-hydrolyzing GMP synthase [Candidatus Methylacidiphilales bacterium]
MTSKILILDFGSQYTQVIARRVRQLNVYSEIVRYDTPASVLKSLRPAGLILSGGPASVYAKGAPQPDQRIFEGGIPILGVCYGMQLLGKWLGGEVAPGARREYGRGRLHISKPSPLFHELPEQIDIWNSHGDCLKKLPKGFHAIATSDNSPYAVIEDPERRIYGLQFHPEVAHTPRGMEILSNFVFGICQAAPTWTMKSFIESACETVRNQVGKERVLLGLSGGVDSSVAAALLHQAIGGQLQCIFVDNGLLRKGEREKVQDVFGRHLRLKLLTVNAGPRFLKALKGVADPERKRKIIGRIFIEEFQRATKKVGAAKFLAQGTLYPDVIESVAIGDNPAAVIKSHHNVGGLPKNMKFQLVEPLRQLFKDEVRVVGETLGLPKEIVWRHPFPGPGLAVRILGPIDAKKLSILREADAIVIEEMKAAKWYDKVWQAFAVLLPVRSVGVMGDERTYEFTAVLRVVESHDGMTADWVRLDHEVLGRIASRITNEVKGINRVVYDISSKPPATIEWE